MKNLSPVTTGVVLSVAILLASVGLATAQMALPQDYTNVPFADL